MRKLRAFHKQASHVFQTGNDGGLGNKKLRTNPSGQSHTLENVEESIPAVIHESDEVSQDGDTEEATVTDGVLRPKFEIFSSVPLAGNCTVPTKLRPVPAEDDENLLFVDNIADDENIIVSFQKLSGFIQAVCMHGVTRKCNSPKTELLMKKRQGLCVSLQAVCHTCKFTTDATKLYHEIKTEKKRGPAEGQNNACLSLPALKSKMGPADISLLLSCLNIKPPTEAVMYRKLTCAAQKMETLNKQSMINNQNFVRQVNDLTNQGNAVHVQTDTSFNNRPRAGMEAGTQSFSPLIEQSTTKKLVIGMCASSKLCSLKNCAHTTDKCQQNYSPMDTIASSEARHIQNNLSEVNDGGHLKVASITTDASTQVAKTIRNFGTQQGYQLQHFHCFIHKMRTVQKHIKFTKLSGTLPGGNREHYMQKLAACVRGRVHAELSRLHVHSRSSENFVRNAKSAIDNLIPCFSGRHGQCKTKSRVCCAHLSGYSPKHLPYGRHIDLSREDTVKLKTSLLKSLSEINLVKLSKLYTTNKSESLHHRVFTYAPKNTTWTRNFSGLCHSAVHSSTWGTGRSLLLLAKTIGITYAPVCPASAHLKQRDSKAEYDKVRQSSKLYKCKRYFAKKLRCDRKSRSDSMYTNGTPAQTHEHTYAINLE
jgi:hypothetical protein